MEALHYYNLTSVAKVLGSPLTGNDDFFSGVSTDTRSLKPGELFIALKGPNFDGHAHLFEARKKGAVAAVVSQKVDGLSLTQIEVENTRSALVEIAKARRLAFNGQVIGLTGSNGKTTVKELVAAILRMEGEVLATTGNYNNDIGLPLTLLKLKNNEAFAVIEMGANQPDEIAFLTQITKPHVALITNAGSAHLEGFGSVKGVAKAKGEIFQGLAADGVAIINADDKYADYWQMIAKDFRQIRFSIDRHQKDGSENIEIRASNIQFVNNHTEFVLHTPEKSLSIKLAIHGKHNVSNVLAAAAVGHSQGISAREIKTAVESFIPVKGRLNFCHGPQGSIIIDDTYNANYDSALAAINVLAEQSGKKIYILGDMLESGEKSNEMHSEIGRIAKQKGIDQLLTHGAFSQAATKEFKAHAKHFSDKNELIDYAKKQLHEHVVVLVKGSRGMKMDEVVDRLVES